MSSGGQGGDTAKGGTRIPGTCQRTAPQLAMLVPPSVNATLPPGALPVTDAVKVTVPPASEGLIELTSPVLATALALTICESAALIDPAFAPSPEYVATILCVPAISAALLQVALRVLPDPARDGCAARDARAAVGEVQRARRGCAGHRTVKVTLAPTIDGLVELPTIVVVAVLALTTCDSVALVDAVFDPSPP